MYIQRRAETNSTVTHNILDYLYAGVLSMYGEGPAVESPHILLRFSYIRSFAGSYLARIDRGGRFYLKYHEAGMPDPAAGRDVFAKYFPGTGALRNQSNVGQPSEFEPDFYYEGAVRGVHYLEETGEFKPDLTEYIESSLQQITPELGDDALPDLYNVLDGSRYNIEIPALDRLYSLHDGPEYAPAFQKLLEIVTEIRRALGPCERRAFSRGTTIARLSPQQLAAEFENGLDSTIAFVLAFVPTRNVQAFVHNLPEDRWHRIESIAAGLDTVDQHNVRNFTELDRIVYVKYKEQFDSR